MIPPGIVPCFERRECWKRYLMRSDDIKIETVCMQAFMEKYNPEATPFTKNPEKYIRWTVADVQRLISEDLFEARDRDAVATPASKGPALVTRASGISSS